MIWQMNPQYLLIRKGEFPMKENDVVEKSWGSELWFANTKDYCGKLLIVEPGKWSSKRNFHYHKIKDETFFIVDGVLKLDIGNDDGEYQRILLYRNMSYRVIPGVKHRFTSAMTTRCKFIEASTHHEDSDSYRCYYNKEKGEWKNV